MTFVIAANSGSVQQVKPVFYVFTFFLSPGSKFLHIYLSFGVKLRKGKHILLLLKNEHYPFTLIAKKKKK